ncbi:hypothetical protein RhiirA5_440264 [Rhizophagus irregularis]|uniref:Uncharacterized protein n=1 Tax=Rhizophagus irregularis TaxID=588596 RepID=A0A2N0NGW8_9GLOM|nr:hypothetical protein RhiirA5_440264 [Rhizophagus irregularis]
MPNKTKTFWNFFRCALDDNKQNSNRVLSIIADEFSYSKLETNLNVGRHTISESRKYAQVNGYGAPPLLKPVIHRIKLKEKMLNQFELFFADKKNVNISLYKTDNKKGGCFQYKEDLEGLCMTCNKYGYLVFAEIEKIIEKYVINPGIQKELVNESQNLK